MPAQAQVATAGPAAEEPVIVVTAQKREQTLAEVPQSIAVVSGETLERQNATSFGDYVQLVPGMSIEQSNPGESRVILRGINTGSVGSTIGIYVDETPFGSSSSLGNAGVLAGDFDTFDIARVEVLRGPQGTLYGANALGGVLRFVTTAPRLRRFEARGQIGVETVEDGGTGWSGNAVINVPVGDRIAVRASGFYRETPGFIDATGRTGEEVNRSESYGGRVSLLFQPIDDLSIRLTAIAQNIRANSPSSYDVDPETFEPRATDPFTGAPTDGRLTRAEFFPDVNNVDYRLYNGTLSYDFGFATATSVTSYGILDQHQVIDQTIGLGGLVNALYAPPPGTTLGLLLEADVRQEKFTQEVRLASPNSGSLEWLIGAYYTNETAGLFQRYQPFNQATLAYTDPSLLGFNQFLRLTLDSEFEEVAGFANLTWHLSPRFEVSAGGRYSHNRQNSTQDTSGAYVLLVGLPNPYIIAGDSSESVFTWSLSSRFELNNHTMFYARVAKGYRPGGPNAAPPGAGPDFPFQFSADTLVSYEVGVRAQNSDRSFAIDASIYYLDWTNILVFGAFPSAVGDVGANDNGGGARSLGAEVTTTLRPIRGLTFLVNAAYNDAKLSDDTPPVTGGLDGDELPFSPRWSVSAGVDYEWSLGGNVTAFVGGNVRLVSDQAADFDPTYLAQFGRSLRTPSYETVDLRAGVEFGNFRVTAFGRNLGNSRGLTNLTGLGGRFGLDLAASPIRPRTFGITLAAGL